MNPPIPPTAVDPATVLTPAEREAARAAVAKLPPLPPAQVELIADVFRPVVRRRLAARRRQTA